MLSRLTGEHETLNKGIGEPGCTSEVGVWNVGNLRCNTHQNEDEKKIPEDIKQREPSIGLKTMSGNVVVYLLHRVLRRYEDIWVLSGMLGGFIASFGGRT